MTNLATDIGTLFPDFPELQAAQQHPAPAARPDAPSKIRFNPENVRNGLAKLVLTLVELIRELLERQALRRIDAGTLAEEEIERLAETFRRLAEEIERLKEYFGFTDEDLNLDLGPLGKLR
jgi:HAMP domain-containing protein